MRRKSRLVLLVASLTAATALQAQHNPAGWIQGSGWNMLFLDQDSGCGGGGDVRMQGNWVTPYDMTVENPRPGDDWQIDFDAAESRSWTADVLGDDPTWFSLDWLLGEGIFVNSSDQLNFNGMADQIGISSDSIMAISTTYVENTGDEPLEVEVCTASDDAIRVDVNNHMVVNKSVCRGGAADCQEIHCAELAPGMNKITAYVWEGGGGWNLRLSLRDPATRLRINDFSGADFEIIFHGNGEEDELEGQMLDDRPECTGRLDPGDPLEPIEDTVNPQGWIQSHGWNLLFLDQAHGCSGGEAGRITGNWVFPHILGQENPRPGEEWEIDFARAESRSWTGNLLGELPTWLSVNYLRQQGHRLLATDSIDFNTLVIGIGFPGNDNIMAVATTYVENTTGEPQTVEVCTASDDSVRIDVNDYIVANVSACRGGAAECQEVHCAELAPGMNKITAYVWEGGGGWNLRVGLRDPLTGLRMNDVEAEDLGIIFHGTGDEDDLEGQVLAAAPECSLGQQTELGDPLDPEQQRVNPAGWIKSNGWNLLLLDQDAGCGGGGVVRMQGNWVAPYDMAEANPRPGDEWEIDFAQAESRGWTGTEFSELPTWLSIDLLRERGVNVFPAELVDFFAITTQLEFPTTENLMAVATTYVENTTDEPKSVLVCTASDDAVRIDVNNQNAALVSLCRGGAVDCQEFNCAVLEPGVNKITAYVWQGGGGWNMRIGLRDPGAGILDDSSDEVVFLGTGAQDELTGQPSDEIGDCELGVNPSGWIRTSGWNLLFPLLNPLGCGGGGDESMAANWVAPYEMIDEDPQAGDVWPDIDFGAGLASGYDNGGLTDEPTWFTKAYLAETFDVVLPGGDLVDYQSMTVNLSFSAAVPFALPNDNVTALATTYVINRSDEPLPVDVCTASDDAVKVIINEETIVNLSVCRGSGQDCQEISPAVLEPGLNRIVVQVWEGGGGWNFRLGLRQTGSVTNLADGNGLVEFLGADLDGEQEPVDPPVGSEFVRGDPDANGLVNLTDAIFILNYLFLGGELPTCVDAADTDNNSTVQLTDGIYLLRFLFLGSEPPPEPHESCGADLEEPDDGLGCESFNGCP